jgi:polysaccharide biosynthesis protein PslH
VVSTNIGAEGLGARDGEHLSIADEPGRFAAAVQDLLDYPARGRMLAVAGRQLYLEQYTWPAAWKKLASCF